MRLRLVERVEVVPDGLDLTAVVDRVAHAEEHVLDLAPELGDQVDAAAEDRLSGQGRVERLEVVLGRARELAFALLQRLLDPGARSVQRHPRLAVAHLAQCKLERALAPEVENAELLERV